MRIIFSSKNVELTEGLKTFIERKVTRLQKISTSLGLDHLFINLDVDRKHKGASEDAVVELIGEVNRKRVVVKEEGKTFYSAFFGALTKMKQVLLREKEKVKR